MATLQSFLFTAKRQKKEANRNLKRVQRGTAGELFFFPLFREPYRACADSLLLFFLPDYSFRDILRVKEVLIWVNFMQVNNFTIYQLLVDCSK